MEDRFGRTIDYLRISLTDRCNLRCLYCMPPAGIKAKPREQILRLEEVLKIAEVALQLGINKFRLTGGEPLLRKGVLPLIKALVILPGVQDVSVTTNGTLLPQMAEQLRQSGLRRLNISLDTLDPQKYREITRGGDFLRVWEGIIEALDLGFHPVKINTVALKNVNDQEWAKFARLTLVHPLEVRFIELMPVGHSWEMAGGDFASCREVQTAIEKELGKLEPAPNITGSGPAQYYRIPGASGTVGFIHAMSQHFCASCNRLRLTADGKLRPCLHDQREIDVCTPIRDGAGDTELQNLFRQALLLKPANYHEATGAPPAGRGMAQIGG
jgi:cyclic pyranopterin phosphate synthase